MSGLFNWGSRNTQVNKLGSVQIQTSEYGVCVPVLFGSNRLAAKLIDYLAFTAKKTQQGGKGGGGVSGYEYFAAVLLLLWKNGQNPSSGIGNIFDSGGAMQLIGTSETFTIPGGGGTHTVSHSGAAFYYDEGVTYQAPYSATVNDYGSDGVTTISGFNTVPMAKGGSGAGFYSVNSTGTYTFSAADAGKVVTISYSYTPTPTNQSVISDIGAYAPAQYLHLSIFNGTRPQSAWGFLASYSGHSLDYPGLVLAADPNMDIGSDATVPSYNFEGLNGNGLAYGGGIADCDPSAIINAILTDPFIGMGYGYLGDLSQMSAYCVANGIFFSPYYDSAKACSAQILEIAKLANTELFSSWDGLLKAVPYGDTTTVGFGKTFTPVTQPLYDLDINDFVQEGTEDPLRVSRPDIMDNSNYMKIEFKNRAKSYNVDTLDGINQASVNMIGLRPADQITAHMITEVEVAQIVLDALLTRASYPYRTFEFKLPPTFPDLEVMDVVTVTHPNPAYGITRWPVRIKEIEEDENTAELTITAEDFPWGAGQPAKYQRNPGGGDPLPGRNFPGDVVAPIIFEVPDRISRSGGPEIWIGTTGQGDQWGGCTVWMSKDGTNYDPIGKIQGSARMGQLLNSVSAVADPDTTSTFDIEMAGANPGALTSSSTAAADGALTLSLIDNELIAYSTVTATTYSGTPVQALSAYTRRGLFGTGSASHGSGSLFLRLDDEIFSYEYDPSLVGTTLHFKFTSFNLVGQQEQFIQDVNAYTLLLTGKFGNSEKSIQNNLVIDSVVHSGGLTADIRIYQVGTSPGTSGTFTRANGNTFTAPAGTITGEAFTTTYYVAFNPSTNSYAAFTDYNTFELWLTYGLIGVGIVTTVDSSGNGGTTGGGGGSGRGIIVSVTPPSTTTTTGGSVTFTATVQGSSITSVTWALDPSSTSGSSIAPSGNTCVFTAAATAHGGGGVIATAVADTNAKNGAGCSW